MPSHPIIGMQGSKPRTKPAAAPNPVESARKRFEEGHALDRNYKIKRNKVLDLKIKREATELAFGRGALIERELVLHQLSFILVSIRQKLLALAPNIRARHRKLPQAITDDIERTVRELLKEIINIPNCVEPDWMKRLEEED